MIGWKGSYNGIKQELQKTFHIWEAATDRGCEHGFNNLEKKQRLMRQFLWVCVSNWKKKYIYTVPFLLHLMK